MTEKQSVYQKLKTPITNLDNWPRLIKLAYIVYSEKGEKLEEGKYIIKPEGFIIPDGSSNVNGVTTDKAVKEGKDLNQILLIFIKLFRIAKSLLLKTLHLNKKLLVLNF